jgi:hypothetical protein
MALRNPRMRAWIRLDRFGQPVPSVLIYRLKQPSTGFWREVAFDYCCTTTTTSTSSTTTTTGT